MYDLIQIIPLGHGAYYAITNTLLDLDRERASGGVLCFTVVNLEAA